MCPTAQVATTIVNGDAHFFDAYSPNGDTIIADQENIIENEYIPHRSIFPNVTYLNGHINMILICPYVKDSLPVVNEVTHKVDDSNPNRDTNLIIDDSTVVNGIENLD